MFRLWGFFFLGQSPKDTQTKWLDFLKDVAVTLEHDKTIVIPYRVKLFEDDWLIRPDILFGD